MMNIKKAAALMARMRDDASKAMLWDLIDALDQGRTYDLSQLYQLSYEDFEVAMALIVDWRFRRHIRPAGGLRPIIENGGRMPFYPT